MTERMPMPTIWRVPDGLWERIGSILSHNPPNLTGRPRVDHRATPAARSSRRCYKAPEGRAFFPPELLQP